MSDRSEIIEVFGEEVDAAVETPLVVIEGSKGDPGKSAYQYAKDGGYTGTEVEFAKKMAKEIPTIDPTMTQSGQAADAKATGDAISLLSEGKVSNTDIALGVNEADGLVYIFIGGEPVGNGLSISGVTMDEITVVDGTMTILALANTPTQNGTTMMIV